LPQLFFLLRRQVWIAADMHNTAPLDHTVRAHHLRHRKHGGHLHDWNARFFELGRDRSAAASGGPSRGGEDHRIDALLLQLLSDLMTQATAIGQRVR
jgi:hypothetical protein